MESLMNTVINSSLFILAWINIGIHDIGIDEGKKVINCKEATIKYDMYLKEMNIGDKAWVNTMVNSNSYRASKSCGGSYTILATKLDKQTYMFEHKGEACERLKRSNQNCWNTKVLK